MSILTQQYNPYWSTLSKGLFRALFVYVLVYVLLLVYSPFFETPFRWVGDMVFDISYPYEVNGQGSGDNTFAYLTLFITLIFTVLISVIWSVLDRHRHSYNELLYWFLVVLRLILIYTMFLYGFVKIFKTQFPYPSLTTLLNPLANFYPAELAWAYTGYSKVFNLFIGSLEVLGGLLLIPRRTQTLGAFVIIGVMAQVVMINFCYDVPVKLFTIHLTLMAVIIFATDHRFLQVFIQNKAVKAYQYYHPIQASTYHKIIFWLKAIGLCLVVYFMTVEHYKKERILGDNGKKPPLYGIWKTTHFIKNGDVLPPLTTDGYRWHYLIVDIEKEVTIQTMDNARQQHQFIVDAAAQKIMLSKKGSKPEAGTLRYTHFSSEILELHGIIASDTLQIKLSRIDHSKFNLNARRFNWIIERPYTSHTNPKK